MNKNPEVIVKNGKQLRYGYTTGSCAAAAATAAAEMLLSGVRVDSVPITLPGGETVVFETAGVLLTPEKAACSVIKDAGDDPDVTDGIEITAEVTFCEGEIVITGGTGVGVVTGKGLQCKVGEAAINPVPRKMITQNVKRMCEKYFCKKGIYIKISALNGEKIAQKTFNPRLGIVGGISILGTTGIVEPMSEQALIETIKVLIRKAKAQNGETILISPGNYGRDYCIRQLGIDLNLGIKFSNFIGETLDYLVYEGFKEILLVGHVGKLVKIAGGVMNTHSSVADCRMEILGVHSAMAGADSSTVKKIMECKTTDEAIEIIENNNLAEAVFQSILEKILFQIDYRTKGKCQVEIIIFTTNDKIIAQTDQAERLAEKIRGMHP
jgi:cobalt-precorrin-5B (C1)-methyltransferase